MYSFKEYLNEINIKGKALSKPIWNGKDYLNENGSIDLRGKGLIELPCIFPENWDENFYCYDNKLTSLEGVPKKIKGSFDCSRNRLTNLDNSPIEVYGMFICSGNPVKFTIKDVEGVCDVKGIIYV